MSSRFQEAVKRLMQKLLQLIDAATAIKECENFIQQAKNVNFKSLDVQKDYDVSAYTCLYLI